jgi:hypothetical protein
MNCIGPYRRKEDPETQRQGGGRAGHQVLTGGPARRPPHRAGETRRPPDLGIDHPTSDIRHPTSDILRSHMATPTASGSQHSAHNRRYSHIKLLTLPSGTQTKLPSHETLRGSIGRRTVNGVYTRYGLHSASYDNCETALSSP